MAFNPSRPYTVQGPDIAGAIGKGQQNALRSFQMSEGVRGVQGRNMLNSLEKQGLSPQQITNILKQKGMGEIANQYQQQKQQQGKQAFQALQQIAVTTPDFTSTDEVRALRETLVTQGISSPEMAEKNLPDDPTLANQTLARLRGETTKERAPESLVQLVPPSGDYAKRRTFRKGDKAIDTLIGQGWNKSSATGTPEDLGMTRSGKTKVDKTSIDALGLRDSITSLSSMMDQNQDVYTLSDAINSWVGNITQYAGVDISDKWKDEINTRTTLEGKTKSVETLVRVATTGSAASAKELTEHIKPRVRQNMDSYTRARARLDALIEFEELTTVRMNQLRAQGYSFSKSGQGNNIQLMATKDGVSVPIQKASPLSAVPTYDERKNEVLLQKLQGADPDSIPRNKLKQMMIESLNELKQEGYNVGVRMK